MHVYYPLMIILIATCIFTIILCIKSNKKKYASINSSLSDEVMEKAEKMISDFYDANDLKSPSFEEVLVAANVSKRRYDPLLPTFGAIEEDKDNKYVIKTKAPTITSVSKFDSAHECAHLICGETGEDVARSEGPNKDEHEQFIDYMAAAILLPKDNVLTYLKDARYSTLSQKEKVRCAIMLAKKYNVEDIVVLRRIRELKSFLG